MKRATTTTQTPTTNPGVAFSYIRFSTPEQLDGDSLRRQTEAAREWCERNGVKLDTKTTFRDLGRSGFTGEHLKNKELGGLATFLAMVEKNQIPAGSFLVCENADRLTRQGGWDAIGLFHKLVMADVRIVLLSPVEQIIDRNQDTMKMMWLLMELSRGHGESGRKQDMILKNWARWRREAGQSKEYRPGKRPFWLDRRGDGYEINEAGEVVRAIYELAANGWGYIRIAKYLRKKNIRPIKRSKHSDGWISPAYLIRTLKNPAVWGRCEELDCDDFFPPVLPREEWYRVQNALANRKRGGGGRGDWVHLLKGLVQNRDTGAVYYPHLATQTKTKVYLTSDYKKGGSTPLTCFPVHAVEQAICTCVRELDWSMLFPRENEDTDKIMALCGEITELERRIGEAQFALENGKPLASLLAVLRKWETRLDHAKEERSELQVKAATTKVELFGDIQAILTRLKTSNDSEIRLKAAALICRAIEKIVVMFDSWGKWRGAWCTVQFKDTEAIRDVYILYHKPHRISKTETREYIWWDCNKMVPGAEKPSAADVFEWLRDIAKGVDDERQVERRERKRLNCKQWHDARRKAT